MNNNGNIAGTGMNGNPMSGNGMQGNYAQGNGTGDNVLVPAQPFINFGQSCQNRPAFGGMPPAQSNMVSNIVQVQPQGQQQANNLYQTNQGQQGNYNSQQPFQGQINQQARYYKIQTSISNCKNICIDLGDGRYIIVADLNAICKNIIKLIDKYNQSSNCECYKTAIFLIEELIRLINKACKVCNYPITEFIDEMEQTESTISISDFLDMPISINSYYNYVKTINSKDSEIVKESIMKKTMSLSPGKTNLLHGCYYICTPEAFKENDIKCLRLAFIPTSPTEIPKYIIYKALNDIYTTRNEIQEIVSAYNSSAYKTLDESTHDVVSKSIRDKIIKLSEYPVKNINYVVGGMYFKDFPKLNFVTRLFISRLTDDMINKINDFLLCIEGKPNTAQFENFFERLFSLFNNTPMQSNDGQIDTMEILEYQFNAALGIKHEVQARRKTLNNQLYFAFTPDAFAETDYTKLRLLNYSGEYPAYIVYRRLDSAYTVRKEFGEIDKIIKSSDSFKTLNNITDPEQREKIYRKIFTLLQFEPRDLAGLTSGPFFTKQFPGLNYVTNLMIAQLDDDMMRQLSGFLSRIHNLKGDNYNIFEEYFHRLFQLFQGSPMTIGGIPDTIGNIEQGFNSKLNEVSGYVVNDQRALLQRGVRFAFTPKARANINPGNTQFFRLLNVPMNDNVPTFIIYCALNSLNDTRNEIIEIRNIVKKNEYGYANPQQTTMIHMILHNLLGFVCKDLNSVLNQEYFAKDFPELGVTNKRISELSEEQIEDLKLFTQFLGGIQNPIRFEDYFKRLFELFSGNARIINGKKDTVAKINNEFLKAYLGLQKPQSPAAAQQQAVNQGQQPANIAGAQQPTTYYYTMPNTDFSKSTLDIDVYGKHLICQDPNTFNTQVDSPDEKIKILGTAMEFILKIRSIAVTYQEETYFKCKALSEKPITNYATTFDEFCAGNLNILGINIPINSISIINKPEIFNHFTTQLGIPSNDSFRYYAEPDIDQYNFRILKIIKNDASQTEILLLYKPLGYLRAFEKIGMGLKNIDKLVQEIQQNPLDSFKIADKTNNSNIYWTIKAYYSSINNYDQFLDMIANNIGTYRISNSDLLKLTNKSISGLRQLDFLLKANNNPILKRKYVNYSNINDILMGLNAVPEVDEFEQIREEGNTLKPSNTMILSTRICGGSNVIAPKAFNGNHRIEYVMLNDMTEIGEAAFSFCGSIISINGPSIKVIGKEAFRSCNFPIIDKNDLPVVELIGESSFSYCDGLKEVNLPSVKAIGPSAFYSSGIVIAKFQSVETIFEDAFSGCSNLRKIYIPSIRDIRNGKDESIFNSCGSLAEINTSNLDQCKLIYRDLIKGCDFGKIQQGIILKQKYELIYKLYQKTERGHRLTREEEEIVRRAQGEQRAVNGAGELSLKGLADNYLSAAKEMIDGKSQALAQLLSGKLKIICDGHTATLEELNS